MSKQPATNPRPTAARKPGSTGPSNPPARRAGSAQRSGATAPGKGGTNPNADMMRRTADDMGETADGLMAKASGAAREAADTVLRASSDGAQGIRRQVAGLLNSQVAAGADMMTQVANSTRLAADDLESSVPQMAGVVRSVAGRIDTYADTIKDQSVEQMFSSASDYTRRQPAAVFGVAALAGFVLFRALKNAGRPMEARRNDWEARRNDA